MNRRNFFSLAALSIGSLFCPRRSLSMEESFKRDLNAWAQKYRGLLAGQPPPLSPEEKLQDNMLKGYYADAVRLPSHSHSINDPGHSHSINPSWIPCDGRAVCRRWYRDGNSWQLL
jgi:hypothetical protein